MRYRVQSERWTDLRDCKPLQRTCRDTEHDDTLHGKFWEAVGLMYHNTRKDQDRDPQHEGEKRKDAPLTSSSGSIMTGLIDEEGGCDMSSLRRCSYRGVRKGRKAANIHSCTQSVRTSPVEVLRGFGPARGVSLSGPAHLGVSLWKAWGSEENRSDLAENRCGFGRSADKRCVTLFTLHSPERARVPHREGGEKSLAKHFCEIR